MMSSSRNDKHSAVSTSQSDELSVTFASQSDADSVASPSQSDADSVASPSQNDEQRVAATSQLTHLLLEFFETESTLSSKSAMASDYFGKILEQKALISLLNPAEIRLLEEAKKVYASIQFLYKDMASQLNNPPGTSNEGASKAIERNILNCLETLHDFYRSKPQKVSSNVASNLAAQSWVALNYYYLDEVILKKLEDQAPKAMNELGDKVEVRSLLIRPIQHAPRIKLFFDGILKEAQKIKLHTKEDNELVEEMIQEADILRKKITDYCKNLNTFIALYKAICVTPGEEFDLDMVKCFITNVNLSITLTPDVDLASVTQLAMNQGKEANTAREFLNSSMNYPRLGGVIYEDEIEESSQPVALSDSLDEQLKRIREQIDLIEKNHCSLNDIIQALNNLDMAEQAFNLIVLDEFKENNNVKDADSKVLGQIAFKKMGIVSDLLLRFKENLAAKLSDDSISPGMSISEIIKKLKIIYPDLNQIIEFTCESSSLPMESKLELSDDLGKGKEKDTEEVKDHNNDETIILDTVGKIKHNGKDHKHEDSDDEGVEAEHQSEIGSLKDVSFLTDEESETEGEIQADTHKTDDRKGKGPAEDDDQDESLEDTTLNSELNNPVSESAYSGNQSSSTSMPANASTSQVASSEAVLHTRGGKESKSKPNNTRLLECIKSINVYLAERANRTNGRFFGLFRYSANDYVERQKNWAFILEKLEEINKNDYQQKKDAMQLLYDEIQKSKGKFHKLGHSQHYYDLLCKLGSVINMGQYMVNDDKIKSYIVNSSSIHKTQKEYLQLTKKYLNNHWWTSKVIDDNDFKESLSKYGEYKKSIKDRTQEDNKEFLTLEELRIFSSKLG